MAKREPAVTGLVDAPEQPVHLLLVETCGVTGGYPWVAALEAAGGKVPGEAFVWRHDQLIPWPPP